jgi:hypothetical protein
MAVMTRRHEPTTLIAFDVERMRPACAIVAAAMGANTLVCHHFPSGSWLLTSTDTMRVYRITEAQLAVLVRKVEEHMKHGADSGPVKRSPFAVHPKSFSLKKEP